MKRPIIAITPKQEKIKGKKAHIAMFFLNSFR